MESASRRVFFCSLNSCFTECLMASFAFLMGEASWYPVWKRISGMVWLTNRYEFPSVQDRVEKYICLKKWMSVFLFLVPFPSLSVPNIVFRGRSHAQSEIQSHGRDLSILPKVYSPSLARNIMTILRISVLAGTIDHETPTWISPRRRISEVCS